YFLSTLIIITLGTEMRNARRRALSAAESAAARERALEASESERRHGQERLLLALQAGGLGTWENDLQTGKTILSVELAEIVGLAPLRTEGTIDQWRHR